LSKKVYIWLAAFQFIIFLPLDFVRQDLDASINFEDFWNVMFYIWAINVLFVIPFFFFWYLAEEDLGIVG